MLNLEEVRKIKTVYFVEREKVRLARLLLLANDIIENDYKMGTEIDELTWGEFTNRYNLAMEELERLIKKES